MPVSQARSVAAFCVLALVATGLAAVLAVPLSLSSNDRADASVPANFIDEVVISGLNQATNVEFLPGGRVVIAEKAGVIKLFDGLADRTPTIVADLSAEVNSFWDRGLLGLAADPQFSTARPYLYALYTYDAVPGGSAPRWNDACPNPPGANEKGCVVTGRLARLTLGPDGVATEVQVLIEDWCQQYPSHSVGDLAFLPDGTLLASAGDGASFTFVDQGQVDNPCADPAGEGGALRSQDVRTPANPATNPATDPTTLDGAVIRIDPDTGAGRGAFGGDANAQRVLAHGFRNPFRMTVRPGTSEVWVADVGWGAHEEINVISAGSRNFGWPCYEADAPQPGYATAAPPLCQSLTPSAVRPPFFSYRHGLAMPTGDDCATATSSISGLSFLGLNTYPVEYAGALFFADYSRRCIWAMPASSGQPDPSRLHRFVGGAFAVDLAIGPGGDLFYVDVTNGLHRISYAGGNQAPTAVIAVTPSTGPAPLTVSFDASATVDPTPKEVLRFEWDLDGDGQHDDAAGPTATHVYTTADVTTVSLKVTDSYGAIGLATTTITPTSNAPVLTVTAPTPSATWRVGDAIAFAASALDGTTALPPSAFTWTLTMRHCATITTGPGGVETDCHDHVVQSWNGVAAGSLVAPDHTYPAYLLLSVTARNPVGVTATKTVRLDPQTASLTLESSPPGAVLTAGDATAAAPFTRTFIAGSQVMLSAPAAFSANGTDYTFSAWSDGGARTHAITAGTSGSTGITLRATYVEVPMPGGVTLDTWSDRPGGLLSDIPSGTPASATTVIGVLDAPANRADGYGQRLRAMLTAPATGDFTFWIAGDDSGVLNLSTGEDPQRRRQIAALPNWVPYGDFDRYPSQRSLPVRLTAGQSYYLEAWAKEGAGLDSLTIAWTGPGIAARQVVPRTVLAPATVVPCAGWCPIADPPPPNPGDSNVALDTWTGRPGSALTDIADGAAPTSTGGLVHLSAPANRGDGLGSRMRTLLTAPATGDYTFWIAADDEGALNLSTSADPTQRVRIASNPTWVPDGSYDVYPTQRSPIVRLAAGQQYYLEAWAKEGAGGDHLSIAWAGPGIAARQPIPPSVLTLTTASPCDGAWCPSAASPPPPPPPPNAAVAIDTWASQPGWTLGHIADGTAAGTSAALTELRSPENRGDNIGTRLRTLVTPPGSGEYTFWIAADDSAVLNLSTSADPAARRTIAELDSWVSPGQYDASPRQRSAPILLQSGQPYYLEAWAKEGGGGDHLSVAWRGPGVADRTVVSGTALRATTAAPCGGAWCPRPPLPTGAVRFDSWDGFDGVSLTGIPTGTPATASSSLGTLRTPRDRGDRHGTRVRALLTVPATGDYRLYLASDDIGVLALSSSADAAGRQIVASTPGWTGDRQWDRYPSQASAPIRLVAGQQYFLEAWAKEGGGGDHLTVGWTGPGMVGVQEIPASAVASTTAGCSGWCPPL